MKRARNGRDDVIIPCDARGERAAFECTISPNSEGFCFSVQLPGEVVAGTPVLAQMSSLDGGAAIQQRPECLLSWLAWHAHRHSQVPHNDATPAPPWDGEVDAFNAAQYLQCEHASEALAKRLADRLLQPTTLHHQAHGTQGLLRLPDDAVERVLKELPPLPPRRLLCMVPKQLHAAALKTYITTGATPVDLSDWVGLRSTAVTATATDVLAAAAQSAAPLPAVSIDLYETNRQYAAHRAVAQLPRGLRSLALRGGYPDPVPMGEAFLPGVVELQQLTRLCFDGDGRSTPDNVLATALAEALPRLPRLQELVLLRVGLTASGCARLAPALARASALTALDVRGNPMGISEWCALAHAGLPAGLAALDVRGTFKSDDSEQQLSGAMPGDAGLPPSLRVLARALRACSRLRQFAAGPSEDLLVYSPEDEDGVHWESLRSALAGVRELTGTGYFGVFPSLPALTSLTWEVTEQMRDLADVDGQVPALGDLTRLKSLCLTYSTDHGVTGVDVLHDSLLDAVRPLIGLTALRLHFQLRDMQFEEGIDLRALVGTVCACTALRTLECRLSGSTGVADVGAYGAQLTQLAGLRDLQVLVLDVRGPARECSSFQPESDDVLAFAPPSLRELTLHARFSESPASFEAALPCTLLTALRMDTAWPADMPPNLPRPVDALAQKLGLLQQMRELMLFEEMCEPCVLEALDALRSLTALEVLAIGSAMHAFPQLVVDALAGRTGLRQLSIVHSRWAEAAAKGMADRILHGLVQFSHLERVCLCHSREINSRGAPVGLLVEELVGVIARLPCLAVLVAECDEDEWSLALRATGRVVVLARKLIDARNAVEDEDWQI